MTDPTKPSTLDAMIAGIGLDQTSPTPLYIQVSNGISALIAAGHFGPESALPSERLLSEKLGVSRVTARKAIDALVGKGVVVRKRGSGNFLSQKIEHSLSRLSSFTEELTQRGYAPSSRWISRTLGLVVPDEMVGLGLSPGARVARLNRVRLADGVPMAYEASTLPESIVPEPSAVRESLYHYLSERGMLPMRALQHVRAANATARQAELLDIPVRQALLFVTRVAYLQDGRAIELTHTWCRSDFYDFVVELRR